MNQTTKIVLALFCVFVTVFCLVVAGTVCFWLMRSSGPIAGPPIFDAPPAMVDQIEFFAQDDPFAEPASFEDEEEPQPATPKTADSATLVDDAEPVISEFMAENGNKQLGGDGTFNDWIEIHNPSTKTIELAGYYLTDDKQDLARWKIPSLTIEPGGFVVVSAAGGESQTEPTTGGQVLTLQRALQQFGGGLFSSRQVRDTGGRPDASFKLSVKGEYLALVKPDKTTVVHEFRPKFPKQIANVSYGIVNLGSNSSERKFGSLLRPTPGAVNSEALAGFAPKIEISQPHGYYEKPFDVVLRCDRGDFEVRYTLDGSAPTQKRGTAYTQPIRIDKTTIVRAAAFRDGYKTLQPQTATYLFLDDVVEQPSSPPKGFPQRDYVNSQILRFGMDPSVVQLYSKPAVIESLKALPSLCISTANANLFGRRQGIYVNAESSGRSWERPASLELMHPDGSKGFQIDTGLRIRGAYSRRGVNPKHAFRVVFRKEYGEGKLKYPLFGDEGADEFDHMDFRTSLNYSWAQDGSSQNNLLRDVFSRDCQRDMGQPYTRSRYYHMFLNGQYWGIYQTQERAVAAYAATYFGGKEEDYDVVKNEGDFPDGNDQAFMHFYNEVRQGITDERYFKLQGLNPDGSSNPDYEKLLDVDNLIDYMAITFYTGDRDGPGGRFLPTPNNYVAIFNREKPDGWKYFEHDSEHSLDTGDVDMTYPPKYLRNARSFNPHWLHDQLVSNKHYLKRFRERIDHHFGVDGVLSYEQSLARLEKREKEVSGAVIAHAARWGNAQLNYNRWQQAVARTKRWMENRTEIVEDQFRERGWFPGPRTPMLSMKSATVKPGTPLYVTSHTETELIYYTLDGTDPRGPDGKPSPAAKRITSADLQQQVLVEEDADVRAMIPTDGSLGTNWTKTGFDVDSDWISGQAPVGYETNSGYERLINLDVQGRMYGQNTSLYVRYEFSTADSIDSADNVVLQMKYDDGFVAYMDGKKIASSNAPPRPDWNSSASSTTSDTRAINFEDFEVQNAELQKGKHVLAIHALDGRSSSDFLMGAQLVSRSYSGTSIPITKPSRVVVRSFDPVEKIWSGVRSAAFNVR
ncbi:MAG: CotH kinase family protein [Planctomycetales bacterium]|nr:CotH kinase family protein [Planctomycetales bacterium]